MNNLITKLVCVFVSFIVFACGAVAPKAAVYGESVIDVPPATQVASERIEKEELNSLGFHVIPQGEVDCSVGVTLSESDTVLATFASFAEARRYAEQNLTANICDEQGCVVGFDADFVVDERCDISHADWEVALAE